MYWSPAMAALTKTNRRSTISTYNNKQAMAAVRKFSNAEAQANDAAREFVESGGKSVWLADSEVQFARLKESDPTNPVKWKDFHQAILQSRGDRAFMLYNSDPKALSDDDKAERRAVQKGMKQYTSRFIGRVKTIEAALVAEANGEKVIRKTRPVLERLNEHADKAKGILDKDAQAEAPQITGEDRKAWAAWIAAKPNH
jgi:hypothetical protein